MTLPMKVDLSGKTAVITGAGGILCSNFAEVLAEAGAKTALLDLNFEAADAVAKEINNKGGFAKAYKADVLNQEAMKSISEEVIKDFGGCNILINGAGGNNARATTDDEFFTADSLDSGIKSFFDLDSKSVEFVFSLNFLGALIPTQAFARHMINNKGVIINISSMNAYTPLTKIPAYSGAKAAVSNFTQWLAVYFSKTGIRVNAIAPGFFSTKQNAKLLWNDDGSPTPRTGKIIAATPMGRFGVPAELNGTLLYLISEEAASFVTGVVIPVDGGFSAYSGV